MKITPEPEPVLAYAVMHKANEKGARWKRVAVERTQAAALEHVRGSGSWYLAPIRDPADLEGTGAETPGLFG